MAEKQGVEFHQYTVKASISIRRHGAGYQTDSLADVNLEEQVSCDTDRRVFAESQRVINEAKAKAARAMNLRQEFESGMRALEMGVVEGSADELTDGPDDPNKCA